MILYFKKTFILILTFICIYNIHFNGLPFSTNVLLGVPGFLIMFMNIIREYGVKKIFRFSHPIASILGASLLIVVVSVFSLVINGTSDTYFIKQIIINLLSMCSVYLLSESIKQVYGYVSFLLISKYAITAAVLQVILSSLMFFNSGFFTFATSLLKYSELAQSKVEQLSDQRLIGFGTMFFTSGIIHGFVLILIVVILQTYKFTRKQFLLYMIGFTIIFVGGMMLARTTLVGLCFSLLLVGYKNRLLNLKISRTFRKVVSSMFCIFLFLMIIFMSFPPELKDQMDVLTGFAFEMFENYFTDGNIETRSTNKMMEMYIFPNNLKTWLIGDGLWDSTTGLGYYMNTDIGYCRMLFYFGVIGLFSFFLYQYVAVRSVWMKNKEIDRMFFLVFFVYSLVLNLKGITDLFVLIALFYFCSKKRVVKCNKK